MYYIYMVLCSDQTFYIGSTDNLVKRIKAHNCGKGAKYTRGRCPVKLVYWEKHPDKGRALQREYRLKQWSREEKCLLLTEQHLQQAERTEK